MLFADAVASDLPSAGSAISWGAAVVTSLFAYLASRDRLKFDAERKEMQAEIKILTAEKQSMKDDIQELRTETAECHEQRQHQAEKMEAQDAEIRKLWAKLADQAAPESPDHPSS